MSPILALQSPVFLFYLALAASLLVVAGVILAVLKWGLRANIGHAWKAYCGWLYMVPLLLLAFYLGREAAIVFLTIVAILGFREFAYATSLHNDRIIAGAVYLGIIGTGGVCWINDPTNGTPGCYGLFMALPIFVIAAILVIPVVRNRGQGQLQLVALAIVGFVYFGWMFGHVAFLANSAYAYCYLGYLVVAVELNDVAAYVFGKMFGRRPLRDNISPKKTWEGAAGGLAVSLILPWILLPTFPHFEKWDCLLAGLIVGVGGQLGDLVVSVFKRDLGIKDMGTLIPGHGGVLDRIDSLIFVAPLFFHYIRFSHDLSPPA
jgi:phosphatidate cytidylyltransferase